MQSAESGSRIAQGTRCSGLGYGLLEKQSRCDECSAPGQLHKRRAVHAADGSMIRASVNALSYPCPPPQRCKRASTSERLRHNDAVHARASSVECRGSVPAPALVRKPSEPNAMHARCPFGAGAAAAASAAAAVASVAAAVANAAAIAIAAAAAAVSGVVAAFEQARKRR
eukprot:6196658-Pleurochrysis_carterae.AAC.3